MRLFDKNLRWSFGTGERPTLTAVQTALPNPGMRQLPDPNTINSFLFVLKFSLVVHQTVRRIMKDVDKIPRFDQSILKMRSDVLGLFGGAHEDFHSVKLRPQKSEKKLQESVLIG
jgi:hypothetical protein